MTEEDSATPADDDPTLPPAGPSPDNRSTLPPNGLAQSETLVGDKVRYFGDYELLDEIARGGMGVVYKARQVNLNRIVALKMILAGQFAGGEDIQRFHTEAEAAAKLDHPGIVPIFEIGEHQGQHYFSMGYVEGKSLADRVAGGPIPPREAAELMTAICEAMAYAHEQGVIHRDLKPANILIDSSGQPKVTDFGLAKKTETDSGLTGTGQILGTPAYMPPEQASGQADVGPLADVYSLGAIMYCLLTGRPPFQAASAMDTLIQVIESEPVPPRSLNPSVPEDAETICLKCLERNPQNRYPDVRALADDLRRFLTKEPILARRSGIARRTFALLRKKPWLLSGVVSIVCVTLTLIVFGLTSEISRLNWIIQNPDTSVQEREPRVPDFAFFMLAFFLFPTLANVIRTRKPSARSSNLKLRFWLAASATCGTLNILIAFALSYDVISTHVWNRSSFTEWISRVTVLYFLAITGVECIRTSISRFETSAYGRKRSDVISDLEPEVLRDIQKLLNERQYRKARRQLIDTCGLDLRTAKMAIQEIAEEMYDEDPNQFTRLVNWKRVRLVSLIVLLLVFLFCVILTQGMFTLLYLYLLGAMVASWIVLELMIWFFRYLRF